METTPTHAKLYGIALYCIGNEIQRLKATEEYHNQKVYDAYDKYNYFSPSLLRELVRLPNFAFDGVVDKLIKGNESITHQLSKVAAEGRKERLATNNNVIEHKLTRMLTSYFRALRPLVRNREDLKDEWKQILKNFEEWKRDKAELKEWMIVMANARRMKEIEAFKE